MKEIKRDASERSHHNLLIPVGYNFGYNNFPPALPRVVPDRNWDSRWSI